MTRNVTSIAGVPVVPPGSPNVVGFLIYGEVVMAKQALQLHRHDEARNASTNDDNFLGQAHVGGQIVPTAEENMISTPTGEEWAR